MLLDLQEMMHLDGKQNKPPPQKKIRKVHFGCDKNFEAQNEKRRFYEERWNKTSHWSKKGSLQTSGFKRVQVANLPIYS